MRKRKSALVVMPRFCILLIAVALVVLFAGCRTGQTTAGGTQPADTSVKPTSAPDMTASSRATGSSASASATNPPDSHLFPQLDEPFRSTFPDPFPPRDDLRLRTDKATDPVGTEKIAFTIENHTDREVISGEPYMLEMRAGNAWFSVPYKKLPDNVYRAWVAYAKIIPPNGSWTHVIDVTGHVRMEPGRYRLVKEVLSGVFIATEFSIA